jgi:hypothetical protein
MTLFLLSIKLSKSQNENCQSCKGLHNLATNSYIDTIRHSFPSKLQIFVCSPKYEQGRDAYAGEDNCFSHSSR